MASWHTWAEFPSLCLYEMFEFFRSVTRMVGAATLHGLLTLPAPHVVAAKNRALHKLCCLHIVPVDERGLVASGHRGRQFLTEGISISLNLRHSTKIENWAISISTHVWYCSSETPRS